MKTNFLHREKIVFGYFNYNKIRFMISSDNLKERSITDGVSLKEI